MQKSNSDSSCLKILKIMDSAFFERRLDGVENSLLAYLEKNSSAAEREDFLSAFGKNGQSWGYQSKHLLASRLVHTMVTSMFENVGELSGVEYAREALEEAKKGHNVIMVGNHLSYGDVNYLKIILQLEGLDEYPLLVMAGPKVYSEPFRKLSGMAFDTLKMAQPPSRASEGANVSMRELVRITKQVQKDAIHWQGKGRILFFFPEGSRSRDGELNRFIPASARYLRMAKGAIVVPVGVSGTEGLLGVDSGKITVNNVKIGIGKPISLFRLFSETESLASGDARRLAMDRLGFAVASLLPSEKRGVYADEEQEGEDNILKNARSWT